MNTRLLRILAAFLAIGAIAAAIVGVRLSSQPAEPALRAAPEATEAVVAARRKLPAGQAIAAEDLVLKPMPVRPRRSFGTVQELVGKVPAADVPAGEALLASHFTASGALAGLLRPDERAVAVKVDEVIGLGGFAQPGDHVDVLLYLRGERETDNKSSAQVALQDVRVLAFGDAMQYQGGGDESATREAMSSVGLGADKDSKRQQRGSSRSAVLAVPEAAATRLMLAASSGTLRLALRPPPAADPAGAGNKAPAAVPAAAPSTGPASRIVRLTELANAGPAAKAAAAPAPGMIIYEGEAMRRVAVPTHGRERQP